MADYLLSLRVIFYEQAETKDNKIVGNGIIHKVESGGNQYGYPVGSRGDFMPFVELEDPIQSTSNDERAYHLGMTIGFDFIQPQGQIDGNNMIFSFSGDDDVWVFVDGNLLLDIGGIHSEAGGTIDFTTGTITVYSGPKVTSDDSKTN